ncbi:putative exported protein [Xenorhabdus bovienii str. kraussei Quebec]|uniref:Putative exported protein n=1 Tax=Xenorhabdus bovienii str. kraussei Quebec TaxID=1398203 RepID=A0A077PGU0_XENBV|nr:hypothetical protein [Xenorhabdus bovienii]CDH18974.1 putative exported protein [Xenorhabdus bovienii str. kraussei Quebec]
MAKKRARLKRGIGLLLIIALAMAVTLATGWAGMDYPETLSALNRWLARYQSLWLLWRLSLYGWLLWGGWKIWQRVKHQAEYRTTLRRMMVVSLLFILLGEYALSASQGSVS